VSASRSAAAELFRGSDSDWKCSSRYRSWFFGGFEAETYFPPLWRNFDFYWTTCCLRQVPTMSRPQLSGNRPLSEVGFVGAAVAMSIFILIDLVVSENVIGSSYQVHSCLQRVACNKRHHVSEEITGFPREFFPDRNSRHVVRESVTTVNISPEKRWNMDESFINNKHDQHVNHKKWTISWFLPRK